MDVPVQKLCCKGLDGLCRSVRNAPSCRQARPRWTGRRWCGRSACSGLMRLIISKTTEIEILHWKRFAGHTKSTYLFGLCTPAGRARITQKKFTAPGYLDTNMGRDSHLVPPPSGHLRRITVGPIPGAPQLRCPDWEEKT